MSSEASSGGIQYVVRSESDGGYPGYGYDDEEPASERAAELNEEDGLPDDHRVVEEES
jgi:hypothetical protein